MKLVVDNINSLTGWSGSGGASIHLLNELPEYIAGNNSASVMFQFAGLNSYVEKTYGTDVSDYNELTLWITSNTKGSKNYRTYEDYEYKIDLGNGKEYYLEVYEDFFWVNIDISDIDTIDRIRITALHSDADYVIISYLVVSNDEFPLDILQGLKEQVEYERDNYFVQKTIGQITGTTGDTSITFSSVPYYIERHMAIEINDGVNSEFHHIINRDALNDTFDLGVLLDGKSLLNDYTDANVYVYYPVRFGLDQKEIILPSIALWGFVSDRQLLTNELDKIIDTVKTDNTYKERQVGQYETFEILFDCESLDKYTFLQDLSSIVNQMIGKKIVWINGRKAFVDFSAAPTELRPNDEYEIVPKIQYTGNITIRRELYKRQTLYPTTTITFDSNIVEQGEL